MLHRDLGDRHAVRGDDIGGIQPSAHSHLHHGLLHARVGEMSEGHGSGQLEEGKALLVSKRPHVLGDLPYLLGQAEHLPLADAFAVHPYALPEVHQVGRGVQPGTVASFSQHRLRHRAHRPLAVRSRHVQRAEAVVRIAQPGQQLVGVGEAELYAPGLLREQPTHRRIIVHAAAWRGGLIRISLITARQGPALRGTAERSATVRGPALAGRS